MQRERIKESDFLNHILGKYIGYAINDPKKYPSKPFLYEEVKKEVMNDEQMERKMRELNRAFGGIEK